MSLLSKVLIFAAKEVVKPMLSNVGRHLGNACGNVLGRKIDEKHGTTQDEEDEDGAEEVVDEDDTEEGK